MEKRISLNRTTLKIIAIISMVIDHTAWGFVDFYSPLGQFLHVCGRMTIPIMCFFIAEGFRKTRNLKKYIYRMITFAVVSVVPFYIFFHEEYGYRMNIIFDLTLGLLLLTVLESKNLNIRKKVLLSILLFLISAVIGGWIITPMLFILAFYYGRNFKEKAKWFIIADVATVALLVVTIILNSQFHFMKYEWVWWDKFYLLGFMLALPLLYCYNGEKGPNFGGRYFFYVFYPLHFLVLAAIKAITVYHASAYDIYFTVHVVSALMILITLILAILSRPSRGQNAVILFTLGALVYNIGFILEIQARSYEGALFACFIEYFGEMILFISVLYFVAEVCSVKIPVFVYLALGVVAGCILFMLMGTRNTHLFYKSIGIVFEGEFTKLELEYGIGFYMAVSYIFLICAAIFIMCLGKYKIGSPIEKKRLRMIFFAIFFCWLPYILKLLGVTRGYEVPAIGITCAVVCMYLCLIRYGFFDSVVLASANALDHGHEGIVVLSAQYKVVYQNKKISEIFGQLPTNKDMRDVDVIGPIVLGDKENIEINGRIYDFLLEPLMEGNYLQGHMLWALDNTEHYETLKQIKEMAIRDALTGMYNRNQFQRLVEEELSADKIGTMVMMDMDNFKRVNDQKGHQCGDALLIAFADILSKFSEDEMLSCRIGGDEFCGFIKGITDEKSLGVVLSKIMRDFDKAISDLGYEGLTSISIGAKRAVIGRNMNFKMLYSQADATLYEAKTEGKNRFVIH